MGRKQRNFPRGKFILRTPRETEKGQMYAVYIYYYWQGKQLRRSTDLFVANKDWNENANNGIGEFRASYGKDYREKNMYLKKLLQGVDDKIFRYIEKNRVITYDIISGFLDGDDCALRHDNGIEFVDFAKESIASGVKDISGILIDVLVLFIAASVLIHKPINFKEK